MILAELEIFHSRPVAPTRRVALGRANLPTDPPPGVGGVLLGGIVAANVAAIDPDLLADLSLLTTQLEQGHRIAQPRLRYRFQTDHVGLQRSRHRLVDDGHGGPMRFELDDSNADPSQHVLGAVYAAGQLPTRTRRSVMATLRRAISWQGPVGPDLIAALAGFGATTTFSAHTLSHPVEWALSVLGEPVRADGIGLSRAAIQRRYRALLIAAHPDQGGVASDAAQRIAELSEARRILLGP